MVAADPSILINSMEKRANNYLFVQNIVHLSGSTGQVLLDQSHLPPQDLDTAKEVLGTARHSLATPLGTLVVIATIIAVALSNLRLKKGERP